jgi:hypothetical protein
MTPPTSTARFEGHRRLKYRRLISDDYSVQPYGSKVRRLDRPTPNGTRWNRTGIADACARTYPAFRRSARESAARRAVKSPICHQQRSSIGTGLARARSSSSARRANISLANLNATSSTSGASSISPHGESRNCSTRSFAPFEPASNFNRPCDDSGVSTGCGQPSAPCSRT